MQMELPEASTVTALEALAVFGAPAPADDCAADAPLPAGEAVLEMEQPGTSAAHLEAPPFEELLTPLLGPAYGAALHMTRNREDAEDLVQDATLRAFRAYGSFQAGTNFKAWFFRILTNCFISKQRARHPEVSLTELEDAPALYIFQKSRDLGILPEGPDPARAALGRLEASQVADALQALPDEYRLVATMYFVEDFRYQDIAAILRIPVGTVRSRLHRARRILQAQLWRIAEDNGLLPLARRDDNEEQPE